MTTTQSPTSPSPTPARPAAGSPIGAGAAADSGPALPDQRRAQEPRSDALRTPWSDAPLVPRPLVRSGVPALALVPQQR